MAKTGKSGWVKWLVILVVLAGIAAGAIWYFNDRGDGDVTYQTTPISKGEIIQAVTATGTLSPVLNVTVGSQISGRIARLYADFNSVVTSNQIIAEIDPSTYQANIQRAEADLSSSMASLELSQLEARRASQLYTNNLISPSDYDASIANLHQTEATVKIKRAALDSAKVDLSRCTIYSPVNGVVLSRNVDVGQTVAASMSAPILFQIANDLAKMQIDANVSEAEIGGIEDGQPVTFSVDAFPGRTFHGQVKQIRNSFATVQNVVTYDTVIEVSNPDLKLRPGMTATASIITAQRNGALKIPNAALRFKPLNEPKAVPVTNALVAKSVGTNAVDTNMVETASTEPPLTGNEPPEVLMRRVREMRDRGEEIPEAIRTKMRELFQSGALQRQGGGGGGGRRGGGGGGGAGGAERTTGPAVRTVYILAADDSGKQTPKPVRVRTGISDGGYTEILDGLKEGDVVITSAKYPQATPAPAASGQSPFGGGGGGGFGGGRGGR